MSRDWLETVLEENLGPVKAPEGLWGRVRNPDMPPRRSNVGWKLAWAAACVVVVAGAVGVYREWNLPSEAMAVRALHRGPGRLGETWMYSARSADLRAWVKQGTGLDVPMPPKTSNIVQVIGARTSRGMAQVSYRVAGADAVLLVTKDATPQERRHHVLKTGTYDGSEYLVWSMHGETFTVASSDAKSTCVLCHGGGTAPTFD